MTRENEIFIEAMEYDLEFVEFSIAYDDETQKETYTAVIAPVIEQTGNYGLMYECEIGNRNAGMTAIGRGNGALTYTRAMNHFADSGASGYFHINYCVCSVEDDGTVICRKAESNEIYHVFE